MTFQEKVLQVVSQIPRGQTLTYAQAAMQAGSPKAARAVGNILKQNFDPAIPCHRVIRSDGTPGKYNRGAAEKVRILASEGIKL